MDQVRSFSPSRYLIACVSPRSLDFDGQCVESVGFSLYLKTTEN